MGQRVWSALALAVLVGCTGGITGSEGGGDGAGGGTSSSVGGGTTSSSGGGSASSGGGSATPSGCAVQALLTNRCAGCHAETPKNGALMPLTTLEHLKLPSVREPSKSNAERSLIRMRDVALPMPPLPEPGPMLTEIATLEAWVMGGSPACTNPGDGGPAGGGTGKPSSPNLIPQDALFTCSNLKSDAPTRLRRLNRWEWARNVGGPVTRSWTGFSFFDNPLDPSAQEPYGTYASDETIDESMVEIVLPIVEDYGATWAGPYTGGNRLELLRTDQTLRCTWDDANPSAACIRNYCKTLLERGVLYRPAKPAELDRLVAFATKVLAAEARDGGQGPRTHSLSRVVTAAMMTTGALFREELGTAPANGRVTLTDAELAQQLAYALGARGPRAVPTWRYPDFSAPVGGHYADVALAAADGGIRQKAVVDSLVRANVGAVDPMRFDLVQDLGPQERGRRGESWLGDGVANFFREWLGYAHVAQVFKERPEATSAYDDGNTSVYRPQLSAWDQQMGGYYGYESTLVEQMDDFVARVVMADTQVLKTLLTSRTYFLPATVNSGFDGQATKYTGQAYGTEADIDATNAQRWRTFPMNERAGVLTHPAWLASHGGNFEDDPSAVHRGKWVREQLLCGYVPPLSEVRVQAMVGPHDKTKNARARLEAATQKSECQGCHGLMNPLGYPFETYNHAGYLRKNDHAPDGGFMAPDGKMALTGMPDPTLNGEVRDAVAFSEKLADSPWVKRCFVRHVFRSFMGRDENRTDACTLAQMEQAYDSSNGSFKALLSALMTSETWTTRRVPEAGE